MSMSRYLWAVARSLRTEVYPSIEDAKSRSALDDNIRVLAAVANALEADGFASVLPTIDLLPSEADTDRLPGPPENLAAYRTTGATIAQMAAIFYPGWPVPLGSARTSISWEKALLDAGIERMNDMEHAEAAENAADDAVISQTALQAYLRDKFQRPNLVIEEFRQILGGYSRRTAVFSVNGAPGLPDAMVVQRAIPGLEMGSAFLREADQFDLLTALRMAGLRVPVPVAVESGMDALGAPFLITERSAGSPAQAGFWGEMKEETVAFDLAREMALLHAQPLESLPCKLTQSRQPRDLAKWTEELEVFAADWYRLAHWPSITMSAVIAWLRANVDCLDDRRSIVHNDMVFHNILAENGRITAVLDWEQASIGHPGEDLGYCYPMVTAVTEWNRFMHIYREAGGPPVSQRQIDFFALRAGLRLMGLIMKGGRRAFESGASDSVFVASAGAYFTQRLHHRIAGILKNILESKD